MLPPGPDPKLLEDHETAQRRATRKSPRGLILLILAVVLVSG